MEAVWKPRCGVAVEVPADRICTIFVQGIHRIYRVTLGLTHLLSVLILYVTKHDNILVRRLVKEQCGDCHQGIEPSSCLVNRLTDEVSREVVLEDILILKRIMPLCKWHRTGIEPAVDNLRYTLHLAATIRTLDRHCINVWTVQLDIIRAVVAHRFQFLDRTDCMTLATRALPDIQWSSPVTVTGQPPVLNIFQPCAETSLTDTFRNPVYGVIILHQSVLHCGHLDEPCISCIVDKRCVTSPAVWILMLKLRSVEQKSCLLQINEYRLICILYEQSCVRCFLCHITLAIDKLNEWKVVFSSDVCIVLTKCRCDMNDTCTVGHRYIGITCNVMSFLWKLCHILLCALEERLVFLAL